MKYNFFLFFISLILTFSCEDAERVLAQGDLRTVESVDIQGNRIYSDKLLFKFIKTKPGQKLTREAADDLMTLQSLGIFDKRNVELIIEPTSKNKVAVIFQVLELPIIKKVKIDGLKYLMKEEILNELRKEKIETGKPYNFEKMADIKKRIGFYLAERGLFDAKITVFEKSLSAATIEIGLIIDEMPNGNNNNKENGGEK